MLRPKYFTFLESEYPKSSLTSFPVRVCKDRESKRHISKWGRCVSSPRYLDIVQKRVKKILCINTMSMCM